MHKEMENEARLSTEQRRELAARLIRAKATLSSRSSSCLHRLFEAHAALSPLSIALTCEDQSFTYGELNDRANRLARRLREDGVGPEVAVGLYADRSCAMIIGVLAVLKAGGFYVPLDTAYPADRLAFMMADANASILLTHTQRLESLPVDRISKVVDLDDLHLGYPEENLNGGAGHDNAAYVIYTSGSTGTPKGVVVTHQNVSNLLASTQPLYEFNASDVWTLFHSFAFDFSVWEIWGGLTFGGRLVVVPYWLSRSPDAFLAMLATERVTILNQTPSAFRQLIRAEEDAGPSVDLCLRFVIFGGEALEPETLGPWFERHGDEQPQLVNMYGITETTVHVTFRRLTAGDLENTKGSSPIGVPIPGWRVRLLDAHRQPVPVGVVGEMYVGGLGVARGYLGLDDLTAERFITDPFTNEPGARLYRSGDLARRNHDGSFDYVGRADHQVKVRGFRIELGEIEVALLRHPVVREAVVTARDDPSEDRRLVAYYVGRGRPPAPDSTELRRWLRLRLPEYMVPSFFVAIDRLPLTPNGKIDREALPAPTVDREREVEGPRNEGERLISRVWAEVLGVASVGVPENFFDLGGHSLLAVQVVSRLRVALGFEVSLRALFENPTVAGLAERIEVERARNSSAIQSPIPLADRSRPIPLSFAQESLWFLDRLAPGRPTFNVTAAVRVVGVLDLDALKAAFAEILLRHESLRTTFSVEAGRPVQIIGDPVRDAFRVLDLADEPSSVREAVVNQTANDEARTPFDLEAGPLARACVLRVSATDHAVVLTMHHIATDGWSIGVAAAELATLYEAFRKGEPSPLHALPIQYADYAVWQRDFLSGPRLESLLGFWTDRLKGVPPLDLPTDHPRPAVRSARGATRFFRVPERSAEAIRDLARREGATPFMTLLAAFQTVIGKYSGQVDFAIGSPVANRGRAELEGLIGNFINVVVLRARLEGDPTFQELLRRVRDECLGAFEHQEFPFELVVEALQPERDLSRTPVFQVLFVFQNTAAPDVSRSDLSLQPLDSQGGDTGSAKFDLTLAMADDGLGMIASLEYDVDLFEETTVDRIRDHFLNVLETVADEPDQNISTLPWLTPADQARIASWNRTDVPRHQSARIHRLFEERAAAKPWTTAVEGDAFHLTYGELDAAANRLANRLRSLGVGPDVFVGIAVERSTAMAVGLLAILKAGGAFVPLDPSYPNDRLALMLADVDAPVVLTQAHLVAKLPPTEAVVLVLDQEGAAYAEESDENPLVPVSEDHAAYVIYTSGSTGAPKGVVIRHGGVANHALAAADLFEIATDDRILQFASLSFDIAIEELFPAWSRGATVVLRGGDETLEPAAFNRWIEERRITILDLPTAYWHAWTIGASDLALTLPRSLRLVVVGGEKALSTVYDRWKALTDGRIRWLNTYGPTEATVIATAYEPSPDFEGDLPIGYPIANAKAYVLDSNLRQQPIGMPGELYLGGAGVARGYWNDPILTSSRFLADPFANDSRARLFKTGDRARWRADGNLEFLGRLDAQVKIRGYRVEPGEVEAILLKHPAINEAIVVARREGEEEWRLDAFYVSVGDTEIATPELRRFLQAMLPNPHVPSTFTKLTALPRTSSGKIDRSSLPASKVESRDLQENQLPARNDFEQKLVVVWQEVLGVNPVGVLDSFFDLGGHSLMAIRLLSRIEEVFGQRLELASLFLGPTVEDQARLLDGGESRRIATNHSPLIPIQPEGTDPPFFCIHGVGGSVYGFQELARAMGPDRPFYGLQAPGLEEGREPFETVESMAAHYLAAIRAIQPAGPYHLGGWSMGGIVAFEMARQLADAGQTVATLALIDSFAPNGRKPRAPRPLRELAREVASLGLLGDIESADEDEDAFFISEFVGGLGENSGADARRLLKHLRTLDPDARRADLLRAFRLEEVFNIGNGLETIARLRSVLRANLRAAVQYRPRPYGGDILVFRAERGAGRRGGPTLGWSRWVTGKVFARSIPGDHAGILKAPNVATLASTLSARDRGGA